MRTYHWTWAPLASLLLWSGCAVDPSFSGGAQGEKEPLCVAEGSGCSEGCEKDSVLGCVPAADADAGTPDSKPDIKEPPACDGKGCEPPPCECVEGTCTETETCSCEGVVCEPPPPPACECIHNTCTETETCSCEGVVCEPPPVCECTSCCTLTQGYWKNHEEDWPVSSLSIGGTVYSAAELDAILETASEGDASLILAHQLIAAMLNVESGATCDEITGYKDALAWFDAHCANIPCAISPDSDAGAEAVGYSESLDAFNNGNGGAPHCD